jgi:hypothetical protein
MLLYKLNERKMGCKAVVRISTTVENYEDKFGIGFLVIKRVWIKIYNSVFILEYKVFS